MLRVLTAGLFAAILLLTFDPAFFRRFSSAELARRADPTPELAQFTAEVSRLTQNGATIAVVLPYRRWSEYSGPYFRTNYHLAGRTLLPVVGTDDAWLQANLERAQYVAAWGVTFRGPGQVIYEGHHGVLVRQR